MQFEEISPRGLKKEGHAVCGKKASGLPKKPGQRFPKKATRRHPERIEGSLLVRRQHSLVADEL
jgi:hypothetical protein